MQESKLLNSLFPSDVFQPMSASWAFLGLVTQQVRMAYGLMLNWSSNCLPILSYVSNNLPYNFLLQNFVICCMNIWTLSDENMLRHNWCSYGLPIFSLKPKPVSVKSVSPNLWLEMFTTDQVGGILRWKQLT